MKNRADFLKCLKTTPIVQTACQKTGVSRATFYRWRKKDPVFKKKSDIAIKKGFNFINDIAESQLISLIKDKNMTAIIFWLKNHHQNYSDKRLYLSTPEQRVLVENISSGNKEKSCLLITDSVIKGKISTPNAKDLVSIVNRSPQKPLVSMLNNTDDLIKIMRDLDNEE